MVEDGIGEDVMTGGFEDVGRQLACVEYIVEQSVSMHDSELVTHGSTLCDGEGDGETGGDVIIGGVEDDCPPQGESVWYCVKHTESLQLTKLVTHGFTLLAPTEGEADDEIGGEVMTGGLEDAAPPQGESV
jgi:hypothetical protein